MIVIGIDPDSNKHGVATYEGGMLKSLAMMTRHEIIEDIESYIYTGRRVVLGIENVKANNFVYARNNKATKAEQAKVGLSIGRCQQAQTELECDLIKIGVPFMLYNPTGKNFSRRKEEFQHITGWTKQSNEDTRSAAYFGLRALGDLAIQERTTA